jgi:hypothetical protein
VARLQRLSWTDIPQAPITLPGGHELAITLGLGSGLSRRPSDPPGVVHAVTDRGPNFFISQAVDEFELKHFEHLRAHRDAKLLPTPGNGPSIATLRVGEDSVELISVVPLVDAAGERLSGRPPDLPGREPLFEIDGSVLAPSAFGADIEAIAALPDGSFALADEYGPALLFADARGRVSARWTPAGAGAAYAHRGVDVSEILPARALRLRPNRGIEALCASADGRWLYAGFQSALTGEAADSTEIWKLDAKTGALAAEWRYPFDPPASFRRDAARRTVDPGDLKICEFAWAGEDRLIVLERIAHTTKVYLAELGAVITKTLLFTSDDHPEMGPDMEGMALLAPDTFVLVSDNDFGVEGAITEFWRITLDGPVIPVRR